MDPAGSEFYLGAAFIKYQLTAVKVCVKPGSRDNYIGESEADRSLTYLHGGYSAPESVPRLQEFEVSEAILSQMTGGRQTCDASTDDEKLVIVLQVLLLLCSSRHQWVTVSAEV